MRLSEHTSIGPVVLVLLRGFPGYQCPLCNRQVQEYIKAAPAFMEAGARVLMVYPGPQSKAKEFTADKQMPQNFHLVIDPDYEMTDLYGLRWDKAGETAYPSTFVIDRSGSVIFAKISNSHGGRSKPSEVLEALEKTAR